MRRLSVIGLAAAVLVIALALASGRGDVARADTDVNAGYDLLETGDPTSIDFGFVPIPANFFGPGSDPFDQPVALEGVPIPDYNPGTGAVDGLGPTSAIVKRPLPTTGFPDTIPIEIVELSLRSIAPITVTYNGGQNPELWNLDVVVPENDQNQLQGQMTVRHEDTRGGTFDAQLPVKPILTFTKVDPPNQGMQMVLDWHVEALPPLDFQANGVNWCHTANPLHNPPYQWVIEKPSLTSNFFPGVDCEPVTTKNYFTLDAGAAVHTVQPAELTAPHYKCYGIAGPGPVQQPWTIETQFGAEDVVVGPAVSLCLPTVKNGVGDLVTLQQEWPHIACYQITGQDPPDIVDLVTQFGVEENVAVGQAQLLCMPTLKEVWAPFQTGSPPGPVPTAPHYVCYQIPNEPPDPAVNVNLLTQFTFEPDVSVDFSSYLCAPALKNGEGDMSMPHLKCYTITGDPLPVEHIVELQTQFGFMPAGPVDPNPQLLCTPALKTPVPVGGIGEFPDDDGSPLSTSDPSGGSSLPYAAVAAGLAAVVAVVAGSWYVRRRLSR